MTTGATAVVQVLGRAHAADPVTATARSLHAHLVRLGRSARLVAPDGHSHEGVEALGTAWEVPDARLVVHTSEGGADLEGVVERLVGLPVTVVHHGSSAGADRHVLRRLRGSVHTALGTHPGAREELRALGYGPVGSLQPAMADLAFEGLTPDEAAAEHVAAHPGPLVLAVGPIGAERRVERLLDGFAEVITSTAPAGVLSLCGPISDAGMRRLHRAVMARGLAACEVVRPVQEGDVLARLDHAAVIVTLAPTGLDPYRRRAVARGCPVVGPAVAATADVPSDLLVPVVASARPGELAEALGRALARRPAARTTAVTSGRQSATVVRALGLS